jgi:hypothetical protein
MDNNEQRKEVAPAADVGGLTDARIFELHDKTEVGSSAILSFARAIEREVIAAKAAEAAQAAPELAGWRLVPIEPTEDMVVHGFESRPDPFFSKPEEWDKYEAMTGCQQAAHRARLCWTAMLAAAPVPPVSAPAENLPSAVDDLYLAAVDCPHSIDDDKIILRRDPNKEGNATDQLSGRLDAALLAQFELAGKAAPAPQPTTSVPRVASIDTLGGKFWERIALATTLPEHGVSTLAHELVGIAVAHIARQAQATPVAWTTRANMAAFLSGKNDGLLIWKDNKELGDVAICLDAPTLGSAQAAPAAVRDALEQALEDIADPIGAMKRDVPDGYSFNPHVAVQMADNPQWYKNRANQALDALRASSPPDDSQTVAGQEGA